MLTRVAGGDPFPEHQSALEGHNAHFELNFAPYFPIISPGISFLPTSPPENSFDTQNTPFNNTTSPSAYPSPPPLLAHLYLQTLSHAPNTRYEVVSMQNLFTPHDSEGPLVC